MMFKTRLRSVAAIVAVALVAPITALAAWEPTKTVEFIVPAGTGGGADQMARLIQSIIAKHNLMKQPMVVVNKGGGAGAEGFLDLKGASKDPHKIIITLSNLFTDTARHGRALQLEGPHAGAHDGPRRIRPVGQLRDALQDREGVHRRGEGGRGEQVQDGRHGARSRKTRSSP
jgi:hypothetical protein